MVRGREKKIIDKKGRMTSLMERGRMIYLEGARMISLFKGGRRISLL